MIVNKFQLCMYTHVQACDPHYEKKPTFCCISLKFYAVIQFCMSGNIIKDCTDQLKHSAKGV